MEEEVEHHKDEEVEANNAQGVGGGESHVLHW